MSAATRTDYAALLREGLWWNNPGLAQLLGLCPLLAVSRTLITGLALGLATLAVLASTNVLLSLLRRWIDPRVRLPAGMLVIAAFVTAVDLTLRAGWFELHGTIGLFVPLIVTNCLILARAEAFALRQPVGAALIDGLAHGTGFLVVLLLMGTIRELLAHGTLLRDAPLLFGAPARSWVLTFHDGNLLIAALPPGAFFILALLVAIRNRWLAARTPTPQKEHAP